MLAPANKSTYNMGHDARKHFFGGGGGGGGGGVANNKGPEQSRKFEIFAITQDYVSEILNLYGIYFT